MIMGIFKRNCRVFRMSWSGPIRLEKGIFVMNGLVGKGGLIIGNFKYFKMFGVRYFNRIVSGIGFVFLGTCAWKILDRFDVY